MNIPPALSGNQLVRPGAGQGKKGPPAAPNRIDPHSAEAHLPAFPITRSGVSSLPRIRGRRQTQKPCAGIQPSIGIITSFSLNVNVLEHWTANAPAERETRMFCRGKPIPAGFHTSMPRGISAPAVSRFRRARPRAARATFQKGIASGPPPPPAGRKTAPAFCAPLPAPVLPPPHRKTARPKRTLSGCIRTGGSVCLRALGTQTPATNGASISSAPARMGCSPRRRFAARLPPRKPGMPRAGPRRGPRPRFLHCGSKSICSI